MTTDEHAQHGPVPPPAAPALYPQPWGDDPPWPDSDQLTCTTACASGHTLRAGCREAPADVE